LNYTEEKINEQKILFHRVLSLYEKELSSLQEYETQKWILDLLEIEKEIYKAQLESLLTGVKDEEINFIESQIRSIESRLDFLKRRKDKLEIISPISGYITDVFSPDTLLALVNDKEIILHTPVNIEDIELLKNTQNVSLNIDSIEKEFLGLVISVSREVKFINERQVVFVSIKLDNEDGQLLPGMVKGSFLRIKEISLFEYISRFLNT
jgi:multidrug resistance efflux pump